MRPTRLVVPAAEDGSLDRVARMAAGLSESPLGTAIFVDRRPGENGAVAWRDVAGREPDGHQLAYVTEGLLAQDGSKSGAGVDDFEMVAQTDAGSAVLVVRKDPEAESFQENIEGFGAFAAPAGTPPEVVAELGRAFEASSSSRAFGKALVGTGREPLQRGPEAFAAYVDKQARRFSGDGPGDAR